MRSRRIERLFERYRSRGDGAALAAVFDATAPRLLELACHLVHDASEAEDLVQSTFLAAIRHAQRYDATAPFEGWLYGILWREALKAKRRAARSVDPRDLNPREQAEPVEALAAAELPQVVRDALEKLPRQERDVLEPFLLEDLRADEIARKLERSAGTVRSQIHRALGRLRRNLPASLTPLAGVVPIRGLDVVRGEVLSAAGVSITRAAALVGGGLGSRVALVSLGLVFVVGGWIGLRLALRPAASGSTPPIAMLEAEFTKPASVAAEASSPERSAIAPGADTAAKILLALVNTPKEHAAVGLRIEVWPGTVGPDERYPGSHDPALKPIASGLTDASGSIELDVPAREPLRLELPFQGELAELMGPLAEIDGKLVGVEPLEPLERREIQLPVLYGWEYPRYGRVVADEDGHPLANVRVLCKGYNASDYRIPTPLSTTNENRTRWVEAGVNGEFELRLTHTQTLRAWFVFLAPRRSPLFTIIPGSDRPDAPLEIRLRKSGSLSGKLIDDSGGQTAGLRVTVSMGAHDLVPEHIGYWDGFPQTLAWVTDTDKEGCFELADLAAPAEIEASVQRGKAVVLSLPRWKKPSLRIEPGIATQVEWHLGLGARVTGTAYDSNMAPAGNREIWLLTMIFDPANSGPQALLISDDYQTRVASTKTDESGRFAFESVQPGTWWVGIAPAEESRSPTASDPVVPLAVQFKFPPGTPTVAVDIRPKNLLPIRGKVLRPDGSPMAGAGIVMSKGEDPRFAPDAGQSGVDGTFSVLPTDRDTRKLSACAPADGFPYCPLVEARAGDGDVILRLVPGAKISGEVICPDCGLDQPLTVSLHGTENRNTDPCTLGQCPTFAYERLQAGTYAVLVRCLPNRVGLVRGIALKAGAEVSDVRVELAIGAVLVFHYSGKDLRNNFEIWLDDMLADYGSVRRGGTLRVIVPPGIVKVRPDSEGKERVLTVLTGTETEVVLDDN